MPDTTSVRRLLVTYQRLIDEAARSHQDAPLLRRLFTIGPARFAVEHVRRSLAVLESRYSAHAALAEAPSPAAAEGRERVAQFAASLPAPRSRLRTLAWIAGVFVVARAILALIAAFDLEPQPRPGEPTQPTKPLADALTRLGDLNLANVGEAIDVVFGTGLLAMSLVAVVSGFAAYVVLRPLMTGAIAFRVLRHGGTGARTSWYRPERARAEQLRLDDHESAAFEAVGLRAPPDPWLDLAGKACLAAPLLIAAIALWIAFLAGQRYAGAFGYHLDPDDGTTVLLEGFGRNPQDGVVAAVLGFAAALRLGWLAFDAQRRFMTPPRRGRPWRLVIALVPVLAITFAALAVFDHRPPTVLTVTPPWTMAASWYADHRLPERADRPAVTVRFLCDERCNLGPGRVAGARFMTELPLRPPVSLESTVEEGGTSPVPRSFWSAIPDNVEREAARAGITRSATNTVDAVVYLTAEQARTFRPSPGSAPDKWLRLRIYDAHGNYAELDIAVRPRKSAPDDAQDG